MNALSQSEAVGFWGPVTSTLDWCEANHEISFYVAEFWNTISNINYVFFTLIGLYSCRIYSSTPILLSYLGIAVVGVGSLLFHLTLTYWMQLSDELPMVYCTLICVHASIHTRSYKYSTVTGLVFILYSLAVTLIYIRVRDPVFHQMSYGLTVVLFFFAPIHHMFTLTHFHPKQIPPLARMFALNAFSYLLGFTLWNLENTFCTVLKSWRDSIGYPFRIFLELHAYWHLLTGYGAYGMVVHCQLLRALVEGRKDVGFEYIYGVPIIIKRSERKKMNEL